MALLPPCRSVLKLHIMRGNSIAYLWKNCTTAQIVEPKYGCSGWDEYCNIKWVSDIYPLSLEDIMFATCDEEDKNAH